MKNPYLYEKFNRAVNSMASSPLSLQERILDAYVDNIIHIKIEDIPESAKYDFIQIKDRLSGEDTKSILNMPTDEAISIALSIISIADSIQSE